MTPKQSTLRLSLYVVLAMISAATAGVTTIDFSNPKQVAVFILAILAAGCNTARSYIDQSPNQIDKP